MLGIIITIIAAVMFAAGLFVLRNVRAKKAELDKVKTLARDNLLKRQARVEEINAGRKSYDLEPYPEEFTESESRQVKGLEKTVSLAPVATGIGVCLMLLAGAIFVPTITSIVPTKQVGIPVTFGQPGAAVKNGLHFKAPWTQMVTMDATIQSLDATGEKATVAKDVDKADVFVNNNVRWSIKEDAADSLYRDYRDFETVNDSLVQPALRTAVAGVMSDYNPLGEDNPSNSQIADEIKADLQARVGDRVVIHQVSVTLLDFAEATKNRINALNTERGNTRIAEQKKATAEAEAEANRVLSESVDNSPNVLVSRCLDLLNESNSIPAGFQCWPGSVSGIIVDGKAAAPKQ